MLTKNSIRVVTCYAKIQQNFKCRIPEKPQFFQLPSLGRQRQPWICDPLVCFHGDGSLVHGSDANCYCENRSTNTPKKNKNLNILSHLRNVYMFYQDSNVYMNVWWMFSIISKLCNEHWTLEILTPRTSLSV